MTISIRYAGVLSPVRRLAIVVNGSLRNVASVKVMRNDSLQTMAVFSGSGGGGGGTGNLTASANPTDVYGFKTNTGTQLVTTNSTTVTPNGGSAPYSYSWARVSGDTGISTTQPNGATTAFQSSINASGKSAVFRCTVSSMGLVATVDVAVTFEVDS